ncbi:MAG: hypothetical protein HRT68_04775, partial [Flavobacteriaceae bacterium]|nr:hypothetical protein [Flavobacteriaceae bacterium]
IKLAKYVTTHQSGLSEVSGTQYTGNFVYKGLNTSNTNPLGIAYELEFMSHSEGYVEKGTGAKGSKPYRYVYQYKDHLGNIRLAYSDYDNDGKIDVVRDGVDLDGDNQQDHEIVQVQDYYAFGLQIQYGGTSPMSMINGRNHSYKFGGKELNNELGLGWYDVQARNYDAALGRWMNIDPLSEKFLNVSPYANSFNNPIFFIDENGKEPIPGPFTGRVYKPKNGIITVTRLTSDQRYAMNIYKGIVYASTGTFGTAAGIYDTFISGKRDAETKTLATMQQLAEGADLFFKSGGIKPYIGPEVGKAVSGMNTAVQWLGVVVAATETDATRNELLEKFTYVLVAKSVSGARIIPSNQGLLKIYYPDAKVEDIENLMNTYYIGISLVLQQQGFDLTDPDEAQEAWEYIVENQKTIFAFLKLLWESHIKEEKEAKDAKAKKEDEN